MLTFRGFILSITVSLHEAVNPFAVVAIIFAVPMLTGVTFPSEFIVATLLLSESHVTVVAALFGDNV